MATITDIHPRNLSVNQACIWSGLGRSTFYSLLKSGDAPSGFKVGTKRLFPVADLEAWMQDLEAKGTVQ